MPLWGHFKETKNVFETILRQKAKLTKLIIEFESGFFAYIVYSVYLTVSLFWGFSIPAVKLTKGPIQLISSPVLGWLGLLSIQVLGNMVLNFKQVAIVDGEEQCRIKQELSIFLKRS